jgi:hypothetical protein
MAPTDAGVTILAPGIVDAWDGPRPGRDGGIMDCWVCGRASVTPFTLGSDGRQCPSPHPTTLFKYGGAYCVKIRSRDTLPTCPSRPPMRENDQGCATLPLTSHRAVVHVNSGMPALIGARPAASALALLQRARGCS